MDLSQIEQWTRQALEAEAIRRGIRDPHLRTTRDLIRTVLRQELGGPIARGRQRMAAGLRAFEQARGLFDAATVVAAAFWPAQFQALRGQTKDEPAPQAARAVPDKAVPDVAGVAVADVAVADVAVADVAVADVAGKGESSRPELSLIEQPPQSLDPLDDRGEILPAEPVTTLSMARLLAAQGHHARALAVYSSLLAANGLDPVVHAEMVALQAGEPPVWQERIERLQAQPPTLGPVEGEDSIEWVDCGSAGFTVRWRVTVAGEERARAVLGEDGERVLRLVTIRPDEETVVRSEIREHAPVDAEGDFRIGPLSPDARCHVAVGLRGGRRFVSITHVSPHSA